MKEKLKLIVCILESLVLLCLIATMIFTRIYNGSFFSVFHIFDKNKHLIYEDTFNNGESIYIYEFGEPVFFEENQICIEGTILEHYPIYMDVNNNGKPLTGDNINVRKEDNSVSVSFKTEKNVSIVFDIK